MRKVATSRVRGDTVVTVRRREGVVAIAVDCINVSKDESFYQWLLMNLVVGHTALYLAPSWRDDQWVLQHFRM